MADQATSMRDSILCKLPLELRQLVYKQCFNQIFGVGYSKPSPVPRLVLLTGSHHDVERLSEFLAPLRVCSQMRREAKQFLLAENTLRLEYTESSIRGASHSRTPMAAPGMDSIQMCSNILMKTPAHLEQTRLTCEFQHTFALSPDASLNGPPLDRGPLFKESMRRLAAGVHPCELVISVNVIFNQVGSTPCEATHHGQAAPSKMLYTLPVCARDEPMTAAACEAISIKFPARDATRARKIIEEAFTEKRRKFEVHREHRVCFIRLGLKKTFLRLEIAEKKMLEMLEHLPGSGLLETGQSVDIMQSSGPRGTSRLDRRGSYSW